MASDDPLPPVRRMNTNHPHRCPGCGAATVRFRPLSLEVYTCCRCSTRFTRWPLLAAFLPDAGVVCGHDHHADDAGHEYLPVISRAWSSAPIDDVAEFARRLNRHEVQHRL